VPLPGVASAAAHLASDFLRACKRKGQAERNRREEWYRLGCFLRTLPPQRQADLQQVTHHDLAAFIEQQQDRGLAATTINRYLSTLMLFHRNRAHPALDRRRARS
jgi:site-specific recombinase XerD